MAAQSLLAKLGMRLGTLGTAASLALALPIAEGDLSTSAHTSASRIGLYADRTPGAEKLASVVMGVEQFAVGADSVTLRQQAGAPATPTDGMVWVTSAGMFVRAGGVTQGPFGSGGGTVTSVGVSSTDLSVSGSPVTTSGNITLNINAAAVTLGKMANLAANSIIGNNTGAGATPLALSGTQVTAMLDNFTAVAKGLAPLSGGGTSNFLRADGSWSVPPGTSTGTVSTVSVTTANGVSGSVATATTTPAITLTLGAITPSSVAATGAITGTNLRSGTGTPEGVVTAAVGTLFERTDGGTGTTLYIKETGAGNTGWVPVSAGSGGTIGGSIASTQVAFGSGANTIQGSAFFTFTTANGLVVNLASSGSANLTIGSTAGNSLTSGSGNTLLGTQAGTNLTNTNGSTAVGNDALLTASVGENTAVGANAARLLSSSVQVVVVGYSALAVGSSGITGSVAVGHSALANCTAAENTAVGNQSCAIITTSTRITALGANCLSASANGTTQSDNTAVGYNALLVSTGDSNTVVGSLAGDALTNGLRNTVMGANALSAVATDDNVAIGANALTLCTAANNTAVGSGAADAVSSSTRVVAVGKDALGAGTTAVADCTAIGYQALLLATAANNTAVGSTAGDAITSGSGNTAVGTNALGAQSTQSFATAVGFGALAANAMADNVGVGYAAAELNTSSNHIVAVGKSALAAILAGGSDSTAVGWEALKSATGASNTGLGSNAGNSITTGTLNVFVGYNANGAASSTSNAVAIGQLAIAATEGVAIGQAATTSTFAECIALGSGATCTAANQCVIGSATALCQDLYVGGGVTNAGGSAAYNIKTTGGTGANSGGANMSLYGGISTGTATPGYVSIFIGTTLGSSATPQTPTERLRISYTATAGQTFLMIYDVDNATLERVTVGAADSGGVGFKVLRIPN